MCFPTLILHMSVCGRRRSMAAMPTESSVGFSHRLQLLTYGRSCALHLVFAAHFLAPQPASIKGAGAYQISRVSVDASGGDGSAFAVVPAIFATAHFEPNAVVDFIGGSLSSKLLPLVGSELQADRRVLPYVARSPVSLLLTHFSMQPILPTTGRRHDGLDFS